MSISMITSTSTNTWQPAEREQSVASLIQCERIRENVPNAALNVGPDAGMAANVDMALPQAPGPRARAGASARARDSGGARARASANARGGQCQCQCQCWGRCQCQCQCQCLLCQCQCQRQCQSSSTSWPRRPRSRCPSTSSPRRPRSRSVSHTEEGRPALSHAEGMLSRGFGHHASRGACARPHAL